MQHDIVQDVSGCHLNQRVSPNIVRTPRKRHNKVCNFLSYNTTTLAHFYLTKVEYRQCKFIRTYFLLYQGKMMCESEVNQDSLSRTDFCFIRTEFYLFSGAYKWEFYRFSQEP